MKGGKSKIKAKVDIKKLAFKEEYLQELFNLLINKFEEYALNEVTKKMLENMMNKAVSTKLNQLNLHFYDLIKNHQDASHPITPLKKLDDLGFENYLIYKNNPRMFVDLDREIDLEFESIDAQNVIFVDERCQVQNSNEN